jgi:hypothetical protein
VQAAASAIAFVFPVCLPGLEETMTTLRLTLWIGSALVLVPISASHAGPCTADIDHMQARIDARVAAKASAGPSGVESTTATMNRQPTPSSIAHAEEKLGDVSAQKVDVVQQAMTRARAADAAGDKAGCDQALGEAQRAFGP